MPMYRKPLVRINGQTKQALSTELLWVPGRLRLADRVSLAAADSLELDPLVYNSNMVWITSGGSSTISYINTAESDISQNGEFLLLYFGAAVTLVNSDFLVCPGGANITTAVGDFCTLQNFGSARWKVSSYQRADGRALVSSASDSTKLPLTGGNMTGAITGPAAIVATAADSVDLGAVNSNNVTISGTTAITSFGNSAPDGTLKFVRFADAGLVLTASSAMMLPTAANITTQSNDFALFVYNSGNQQWRCEFYTRADGTALAAPKNPWVVVASAATMDLGSTGTETVTISGTASITNFGIAEDGARRFIRFADAATLVYNSGAYFTLPGSADIVTKANDYALFVYNYANAQWRCEFYTRADGTPLVSAGGSDSTKLPLAGGVMTGQIQGAPWMATTLVADMVLADYNSNCLNISGTSPSITSFGAAADGTQKWVRFASAGLTITYSTTRFALPGGNDIVTQAGDTALFINYGGGNFWRCVAYLRADGTPLVGGSDSTKLPLAGGTMTGAINFAPYIQQPAADGFDIGAVNSNIVRLSGTATINNWASSTSGISRRVWFGDVCTLVNGVNMKLLGGANITTANGDYADFYCLGGYTWWMTSYMKADGTPLVGGSDSTKLPLAGGTMTGALNLATQVSIASAATVAIGAAAANTVNITGTTAITAFDTVAAGARRVVVFGGALTLTHDATKLILPYAASITTVAGDTAEFESLGSGNWKCLWYTRSTTAAVKAALSLDQVNNTADTVKPVSTLQQAALDLKAPLASPALTGTPTAPTPAAGTNTTQLQTTAGALTQMQTFGLGISALPISVSDLNTTMVSQMLRGGGSLANKPANTSAVVGLHLPYSTTYNGQIMMGLTGTDAGKLFYRTLLGGTQGAWNTVAPIDSPSFTTSLASAGPIKCGQYTLSTLPSASAYSGYEIDVTDATGGAKRCRSNGTSWLILNTTTVVS